jgi:hypothetical protein
VAVIVWWLDLQLPAQSVPITTKIVGSNPVHGGVYSIQQVAIPNYIEEGPIYLSGGPVCR